MIILALNCGSSSVKYHLYDWDHKRSMATGIVERIGLNGSCLTYSHDGVIAEIKKDIPDHPAALKMTLDILVDEKDGVLENVSEISAVAHRVVHGGDKFSKSVIIDNNVVEAISSFTHLAPLHNPANLEGIKAVTAIMPDIPQAAVFDTAFHQTLPEEAYRYAIPHEWYDKYKVRKYGFHGTSHLYVSKRAAVMLKKPASECTLITMHIGNGVSHTAIKNGVSVDTSMGMTPLEGAVMGTRSGDIDASVPLFMLDILGVTSAEMYEILNKRSGLYGFTDGHTDRRDIIERAENGDKLCELALKVEAYRLKQYIGKYMAVLGETDAIVFTAGVGENSGLIRQMALEGLEHMGIIVDKEKNLATTSKNGETVISAPNSPVKIFVIPTDEERALIEATVGLIEGTYTDHMSFKYTFLD